MIDAKPKARITTCGEACYSTRLLTARTHLPTISLWPSSLTSVPPTAQGNHQVTMQARVMISPQDTLLASVISVYVVALLAVITRLISRKTARLRLWWDDWIILLAIVRLCYSMTFERGLCWNLSC